MKKKKKENTQLPLSTAHKRSKSAARTLKLSTSMAETTITTASGSSSSSSSSYSSSSPFDRLAKDHIFSILLLLPASSILRFGTTCKRFRSLTRSDILWEAICRRDWGHSAVDALKSFPTSSCHLLPWNKLYSQLHLLDSVCCRKLLSPPDCGHHVLPEPRASHSLNFVSGFLILFGGGREGGRHLDDTWVAHMSKDLQRILKWEKVISGVPSGRFGHSCIWCDDSLILFGGINDHGGRHNDTWVGKIRLQEPFGVTLSWRLVDIGSVAPPPRGAHAGCCIEKRKLLIHGGIGQGGERLEDTWVLILSENLCFGSWQEVVTHPSPPSRSGHTITHIGGSHTVLFGGRGKGYEVLYDVWLFEESEGYQRWIQLPYDLRSIQQGTSLPRVGHSACPILGGRILIYGGEDSNRHRKDDFWVLDISAMPGVRTWNPSGLSKKMWRRLKTRGNKPASRSFHRACVDDSGRYLYVFGGMVDGLLEPAESIGLRYQTPCDVCIHDLKKRWSR